MNTFGTKPPGLVNVAQMETPPTRLRDEINNLQSSLEETRKLVTELETRLNMCLAPTGPSDPMTAREEKVKEERRGYWGIVSQQRDYVLLTNRLLGDVLNRLEA